MESNNGYFNQNQYQPNPYGNQPDQYSQPNPYDQQTYYNQQYNAYQQNNPYQSNNLYQQGPMNEPKDDGGKVLGIISVIFSLFIPLVALVLGIIGLTKAKKNRNNIVPTALNWIGIGTSILTMVLSTIMIIGIIKEINAEDDYSESHSNHVYADSDKDKDDIDDYEVLDPFEDENGDLNPIQSTDSTNTEEFENDLEDLTFDSDDTAETNNDTAVYSENFSDSTESYSGAYTPSYETVSHGDDVQGYIEVPSTYFDFYETDGYSDKLLAHQQYAYGMLDIITHYTFPGEDVPDLESFAASYQISFSASADKCDVYNATFGENQGYLVYAEYSDGTILRAFIFKDNKGNVQYLCVEGVNDEYSDVYKTVFCNYVQP